MSRAIIRVLFGNIVNNHKYRREVVGALRGNPKREWMRDNVYHFVLGEDNYKLLKSNKVKKLELVDKRKIIFSRRIDKMNIYSHKVYLMNLAMEKFDEILFVDFDAAPVRIPDKRMWNLIYEKKGSFNGDFQTLNVGYKRPLCLSTKNGGIRIIGKHPLRHGLNTSVLYCRDKNWLKEWTDFYMSEEQKEIFKGTGTDEHILMYYLDKKYGIFTPEEMVDNFELEIATLTRAIPLVKSMKRDRKNMYFAHC